MASFVSILCVGVVFSVMIEIFASSAFTKKALFSALSLITIYLSVSGIKSLITEGVTTADFDMTSNIEFSLENMSESQVAYTKTSLLNAFKSEGITEAEIVDISYKVKEYKIEYTGVIIKLNNKIVDKQKIIKLTQSILGNISEEDITFL